jgi:NitT/TauT family transport system substrate-binding protein
VRGYYKALGYIAGHQEQAYAIMAKGIGGYLSKPADIA